MATELKDYIRTYDGMIKPELCSEMIELFKVSDYQYVDRERRPSFTDFNISKKFMEKDPKWSPIQKQLTSIFGDVADMYIDELECGIDFPPEYAFEEYRMKFYQNNQYDEFRDHVDVQDYQSARRFVVMFLYLNSVASGGETYFPRLDHRVAAERGKILVFPATWQYRHAGLMPLSESKYIVGTYLHYL